jgi:hypothetical protein
VSVEVASGTAVLGANGENLADVIDVYLTAGTGAGETSYAEIVANTDWVNKGTLSDVMANPNNFVGGTLLKEQSESFSVALHMQEDAGNAYQNLSVGDIYVNLIATQTPAEQDSFDDGYDEDAQYPLTPGKLYSSRARVTTNAQGQVTATATIGGAGDMAQATLGEGVMLIPGTDEVSLDLYAVPEYSAKVTSSAGDVVYPLDVHVDGVAEDNTKPIIITVTGLFPKNYASYNINFIT